MHECDILLTSYSYDSWLKFKIPISPPTTKPCAASRSMRHNENEVEGREGRINSQTTRFSWGSNKINKYLIKSKSILFSSLILSRPKINIRSGPSRFFPRWTNALHLFYGWERFSFLSFSTQAVNNPTTRLTVVGSRWLTLRLARQRATKLNQNREKLNV